MAYQEVKLNEKTNIGKRKVCFSPICDTAGAAEDRK